MLKRRFKEYFSFTHKERKGIIVLCFSILLIIIGRFYLLNQSNPELSIKNDEFSAKVKSFEESLIVKDIKSFKKHSNYSEKPYWQVPDSVFQFDPNLATAEEFFILGFTKNQVNTILKYRKKGGRFYKKDDILKIYGVSREQYEILENLIEINNQKLDKPDSVLLQKEKQFKIKNIEINSASDSELVFLTGIGESFAKRISKYRNRLGGFVYKEQLLEIYGMDSTRYNQFVNQITIDTSLLIKIKINNVEYKDLIKHPYMSKYQVQAILKYRELKGEFKTIDELIKNKLISNDVYIKMKPYFEIK